MGFQTRRIYDGPAEGDCKRVLVDRLWPRGISKEDADLDRWMQKIAPTDDLREWYDHDTDRWDGFRDRYHSELDERQDLVLQLQIGPLRGRWAVQLKVLGGYVKGVTQEGHMSEHIQELWDEPDIPDGVEAFWDEVRDTSYPELPETDGGLCALYDGHEEEIDGYAAEVVLIGQYDAVKDAVRTELRATYLTAEQGIATADTVELEYGLDEMVEDGYSITSLDTSDVQPLQEAIVEAQDGH